MSDEVKMKNYYDQQAEYSPGNKHIKRDHQQRPVEQEIHQENGENNRSRHDNRNPYSNNNMRNQNGVTHPTPRFNGYKTKLCGAYSRGACNNPDCTYAHGTHELRKLPDLRKTKLCVMFKIHGSCPSRENCTYAHGPDELQPLPPNHYYNAPSRRPQQGGSPKYYEPTAYPRSARPLSIPQPPPPTISTDRSNGSYSPRAHLSGSNLRQSSPPYPSPPIVEDTSALLERDPNYRPLAPPPPSYYPPNIKDTDFPEPLELDKSTPNTTKQTDDSFHQIDPPHCDSQPGYFNNHHPAYIPVMLAPPTFAQNSHVYQAPPPFPPPGGRFWFPSPPWMGQVMPAEPFKKHANNGNAEDEVETYSIPAAGNNVQGPGAFGPGGFPHPPPPANLSAAYLQTMLYQHLMYAAGMTNPQDARFNPPPSLPPAYMPGAYPYAGGDEPHNVPPPSTNRAQPPSLLIERQEERKTSAPT